ncbi:MAG: glycoside hydrolase family 28 protein [Bacteroidota bacterium]
MRQFKKRITPIVLILLSAAIISPVLSGPGSFYNVVEFGAKGDGETLSTHAIQAAVDECSKNGGGEVHFPPGSYLSGTIYLKDYVKLNLSPGAILLGSDQVEDFPLNNCDFPSYSDRYVVRALIWGEGLKGIGITGHGTIDGQGAAFRDNQPDESQWEKLVALYDDSTRYRPQARYINRPYIIRLISCHDVLVEDIHLRNSPMWMQHYLNCDFVTIQNISVYNHGSYNNDMIDIDCCRNVVISNCFGDSDDDGITLKSTAGLPTENVTISNCIVSSFCNAIKMGTESNGGFKNITITNCVVRPSSESDVIYGRREGLAGIALEIVDGGVLDGVTISNIAISGTTAPIFMRLGNRARKSRPNSATPPAGTFRNVLISNIVASGAGTTGCSITGIPGHLIENVTLSNIKINFLGGGTKQPVNREVPEHEEKYPESTMFGDLPAYGFFCRHVNNLTFRDIDLNCTKPENRPALICDDVHDLKLFNFNPQVVEKPE